MKKNKPDHKNKEKSQQHHGHGGMAMRGITRSMAEQQIRQGKEKKDEYDYVYENGFPGTSRLEL